MYQQTILIGRLGKDPEKRYAQSGTAVCSFSVATTEKWKKEGQPQERTEWHNITAFNRLAEICGEYLGKGSLVQIVGKLQTDKYERDGITRYSTKIIANEMKMLDTRQERDQSPKSDPSPMASGDDDFEDDIPF